MRRLLNILKPIGDIDKLYTIMADKEGNVIDKKMISDATTNEEVYWYIKEYYFENRNKLIHIQNHVPKYIGNLFIGTSFTNDELIVAEANKFSLNLAIDKNFLYQLKVPKSSNYGMNKIYELYTTSDEKIHKNWRKLVLYGNISLKYYLENISGAITEDFCKNANWLYRKINHGFNREKLQRVIIPPREMPQWLFDDEKRGWPIIEENMNRWKLLMREYPYLRKYDTDDENYIPLQSKFYVDLQNI